MWKSLGQTQNGINYTTFDPAKKKVHYFDSCGNYKAIPSLIVDPHHYLFAHNIEFVWARFDRRALTIEARATVKGDEDVAIHMNFSGPCKKVPLREKPAQWRGHCEKAHGQPWAFLSGRYVNSDDEYPRICRAMIRRWIWPVPS